MTGVHRRFRVALSFSGERRDYVEAVADSLAADVGKEAVLYDRFHSAEFAQPDLALKLPQLYRDESDLIVVFLGAGYSGREWCGLEWRAIYAYIKAGDPEQIMLFRFDDAEVQGLFGLEGFIPADGVTANEAADFIRQRLAIRDRQTNDRLVSGHDGPDEYVQQESSYRALEPRWRVGVLDEIDTAVPGREFHLEYPEFSSGDWRLVSSAERGFAVETLLAFRGDGDLDPGDGTTGFSRGAFIVSFYSESLVSIRYSVSTYHAGAAHGGTSTRAVSYASRPERRLFWDDLFEDAAGLEAVSDYCIAELDASLGADLDWIRQGAGPIPENYASWNLTPSGLLITFAEYQVAPYARGRPEVFVPFSVIEQHVNPALVDLVAT